MKLFTFETDLIFDHHLKFSKMLLTNSSMEVVVSFFFENLKSLFFCVVWKVQSILQVITFVWLLNRKVTTTTSGGEFI